MIKNRPIKSVEPMLIILTYSTHENYSMQMKNIKYFIIFTIQTIFYTSQIETYAMKVENNTMQIKK